MGGAKSYDEKRGGEEKEKKAGSRMRSWKTSERLNSIHSPNKQIIKQQLQTRI